MPRCATPFAAARLEEAELQPKHHGFRPVLGAKCRHVPIKNEGGSHQSPGFEFVEHGPLLGTSSRVAWEILTPDLLSPTAHLLEDVTPRRGGIR